MTEAIHFPHLGIHLKHVGKAISVFGFDIAYYGIIIGIGILAGIAIAVYEAKRTRQNPEDYLDFAIYAIIFSIIGARIYYVIFAWDMYKDHLLSIFNIREGGLAIYGGIIAAVITLLVFANIKHLSALKMLDTACLGLVAGQMIGRWGNFFNREAFGEYTDGPFAMQLPLDAVRVSDVTDRMRNHLEMIDGVRYIQVHPTFLYESLWCLALLIFLLVWRYHKKFNGEIFFMYLCGYGFGRFWIEGLRTDQLLLPVIKIPVSQVLSAVLFVGSLALIIYQRLQADRNRMRRMREKEARKQSTRRSRNLYD